jgi:hypothetical protein
MGRRSRKRATAQGARKGEHPAGGGEGRSRAEREAARPERGSRAATTRAERDAARRQRGSRPPARRPGRPSMDERPPAPWGRFPLSELLVLLGIALMVWGLFSWNSNGTERFAAGIALASLGGLELSLREHLAGYRSHTTLLAGAAAFVVVTALVLGPGPTRVWILVLIGAGVFALAFYWLRELFKRRSGGLGFR